MGMNDETRSASLIIDNDEGLYNMVTAFTVEAFEAGESIQSIADQIEEHFDDRKDRTHISDPVLSELFDTAYNAVDWRDIAEGYADTYLEEHYPGMSWDAAQEQYQQEQEAEDED